MFYWSFSGFEGKLRRWVFYFVCEEREFGGVVILVKLVIGGFDIRIGGLWLLGFRFFRVDWG